jgi:DNA-binding MarR family transcriptional regulator
MIRRKGVLAWLRLARAYQKIHHAAAAQLKPFGLSVAQFDVLAQVGAREGITQQELSEALLVTKGNVCQLVDRLEQASWITRRQAGRANCLYLTVQGRALFEQVVPPHEAAIADQFTTLSSAEQGELLALLRKLDHALA